MLKVLKNNYIYLYAASFACLLSLFIAGSLFWHRDLLEKEESIILYRQAEMMIKTQKSIINWTSKMKGMYAKVGPYVMPSKYIPEKERFLTTNDGKKLAFLPPTYLIRLVNDRLMSDFGIYNHITSNNPLNKDNAPNKWEKEALKKLKRGDVKEASSYSLKGGREIFRLMVPLYQKDKCNRCHDDKDLYEGDVMGGIASVVNVKHDDSLFFDVNNSIFMFHLFIWGLGQLFILIGSIHFSFAKKEHGFARIRLARTEEKFKLMLDYTFDWEEWIAPNGSVNYCSPACKTITGHTPDEFQKENDLLLNIVHPDDLDRVEEHLREIISEGFVKDKSVSNIDFKLVAKDGVQRWISRSCRPVFNKSGVWIGTRVSNRDVTDRQRLYQQVLKSQKLESLTVMATSVAHSFNNRLTVVISNIGKALRELPKEESNIREYLSRSEIAAWKSAEITDQMLLFVGHSPMRKENVDVGLVLRELEPVLRSYILDNIIVSVSANKNEYFTYIDINRLKQVVIALFTNAVDAIGDFPAGRINIKIREMFCDQACFEPPFDLDGLKEGRYCYIEITDNGCGMDDEIISKIFDPFFTTRFSGRGLGMASVLGIIRASRGFVKTESEIGEGTKVKVILPVVSIKEYQVS